MRNSSVVLCSSNVVTKYSRRLSRRSMVKGTVAGVAGLVGIAGISGGTYLLTQLDAASHAAGVTRPRVRVLKPS
jgi:hypothetical protein